MLEYFTVLEDDEDRDMLQVECLRCGTIFNHYIFADGHTLNCPGCDTSETFI